MIVGADFAAGTVAVLRTGDALAGRRVAGAIGTIRGDRALTLARRSLRTHRILAVAFQTTVARISAGRIEAVHDGAFGAALRRRVRAVYDNAQV